MKSLDLLSKRILVIAIAMSAVMISASLFVFSIQPMVAKDSLSVATSLPHTSESALPTSTAIAATAEAVYVVKFNDYDNIHTAWRLDASGYEILGR